MIFVYLVFFYFHFSFDNAINFKGVEIMVQQKRRRIVYFVLLTILLILICPATSFGEDYVFAFKWGSKGTGNEQFDYPRTLQ